jgi:hypothetical protein
MHFEQLSLVMVLALQMENGMKPLPTMQDHLLLGVSFVEGAWDLDAE